MGSYSHAPAGKLQDLPLKSFRVKLAGHGASALGRMSALLRVFGPAWLVMIADVDVASIITGLQSGSSWGYRMVFVMLVLTVPLFLIQDAAGRLGAAGGMGLGKAILDKHGKRVAAVASIPMAVSDFLEYVAEFAGIAIGFTLLHLTVIPGLLAVFALHAFVVIGRQYREAEVVLIPVSFVLLGAIVASALVFPIDIPRFVSTGLSPLQPYTESGFSYLMAASIGAVIMPWMLYFQSGATSRKNLGTEHVGSIRTETLLGALVSEIMMSIIVIDGTRIASAGGFISVSGISSAIAALGEAAPLLMGIGFVAAGFLSLVVVSLGSAWGVLDGLGLKSQSSFVTVYLTESIPALFVVILVADYIQLLLNLMVIYTIVVIPSVYFLGRAVSDRKLMRGTSYSRAQMAVFWTASCLVVAGGLLGVAALLEGMV